MAEHTGRVVSDGEERRLDSRLVIAWLVNFGNVISGIGWETTNEGNQ